MNKICTSIEQSQKLINLGIDISTADMRYGYIAPYEFSDSMYDGGYDPIPYHKDFFIKNPMFSTEEYDCELYAWSLTALLNIIPKKINFGYENDSTFVLKPLENDKYLADYYEVSFVKDNSIDAVFEMVCWLKENEKI